MAQQIVLSGVGNTALLDNLRVSLVRDRPDVIGIAAAFVSTEGVRQLIEIQRLCGGTTECRLIAGTSNAITHPQALYTARDQGWKIRLGKPNRGIFHPKLIVAGKKFSRSGTIKELCTVYVGSSNLTTGGLKKNVECGLIADAEGCLVSASEVFAELWNTASPATSTELRNYAARFAESARRRTISELADLGVNDSQTVPIGSADLLKEPPPIPALGSDFAIAAWAGLQSFTSEYRFQVEFPKSAGKVISQIIRAYVKVDGRIDIYCPDDGTTRPMQYKFYQDNSMFRLNIPNEVPGVAWARKHRDGLAIIEQGPPGGAPLRIRILKPGSDSREIVGRSAALGTWGKTKTRTYGWY